MPKETLFKPYEPKEKGESLIGALVLHPDRGAGLITGFRWSGPGVYTVLWAESGELEEEIGSLITECRIIFGDETF